jgi:predicted short-subunit dehydrogenase-like oxidoreductase (DUF2520 family)
MLRAMRLGIIGGGRAAWAFGSTWKRIGWPLAGVWLRDESRSHIAELLETTRLDLDDLASHAELLLVAVSDDAIEPVLRSIPSTEAIVFHASGARPSPAGGFSLHPLRALPPPGNPSDLEGSLLVFEGEHRKTAKLIAVAAGARFAEITAERKALYHAAAVFGSNYVAAMIDIAETLMQRAGIEESRGELMALAASALQNWAANHDAGRFTGPAARGDRDVLRAHSQALAGDPQLESIYRLLSEWIAGSNLATDE